MNQIARTLRSGITIASKERFDSRLTLLTQIVKEQQTTTRLSVLTKMPEVIILNSNKDNYFWPLFLGLNGGARRDRTADLLRARQALSQLSYGPSPGLFHTKEQCIWWVWEDLNFRPHPYQGCALTN